MSIEKCFDTYEGPDIIYRDICKECGLPVNNYENLHLCDYCAEGMFEELEETQDV